MGCLAIEYYERKALLQRAESRARRGYCRLIDLARTGTKESGTGFFLSTEKAAQRDAKRVENSCAGRYEFGFNGKYKDNEVAGLGNSVDYGMRRYDPRICRFISEDPLTSDYPELTPYQYASLNPIQNIDIDGLEGGDANTAVVAPAASGAARVVTQTAQELSKRAAVNGAGQLVTKTPWFVSTIPWLLKAASTVGAVLTPVMVTNCGFGKILVLNPGQHWSVYFKG